MATRCLFQALLGVCLMIGQPDPKAHQMSSWPNPKAHQMSSWPDVVPLMLTRFFYLEGPNPVAQVLSLYDKQLLKNQNFMQKFHNFRRQLVSNWVKTIKMEWDLCSSLLGSHSTTTPCFRTLCINLPVKNQEKP